MDEYTAPEISRSALVTIDTQKCTLDGGPFEVSGTTEVVARISALVEHHCKGEVHQFPRAANGR